MNFSSYIPTKVIAGRGCVRECAEALKPLGTRALIVTGQSSKRNGALADISAALTQNAQRFAVFDRVTPNPTLSCVREGLAMLKETGADFVIGLGGGSPMDAAKAIAILAVEPRTDEEIFAGGYGNAALPMAHIPTTAGTGSEVTPYAILTNDFARTKTSISSPALFPKIAFLDGAYCDNLPPHITKNTAMDAFSHAAESMLKNSSSPASELVARESLRILYPLLKSLEAPAKETRDALLWASCLAGMAIAHTGTTFVHGMGYFLTYDFGVDHGRANGLLLGETLRIFAENGVPAVQAICAACGASIEEIAKTLSVLCGEREKILRKTCEEYAARAMKTKNIRACKYQPTEADILRIFTKSLCG